LLNGVTVACLDLVDSTPLTRMRSLFGFNIIYYSVGVCVLTALALASFIGYTCPLELVFRT